MSKNFAAMTNPSAVEATRVNESVPQPDMGTDYRAENMDAPVSNVKHMNPAVLTNTQVRQAYANEAPQPTNPQVHLDYSQDDCCKGPVGNLLTKNAAVMTPMTAALTRSNESVPNGNPAGELDYSDDTSKVPPVLTTFGQLNGADSYLMGGGEQ